MLSKIFFLFVLLNISTLSFAEHSLINSFTGSSGYNSSDNKIFWSVGNAIETKILQSNNHSFHSGFQNIHNNPSNIPIIFTENDSVNFGNIFVFSISNDSLLVISNKGSGDFVISDLSFYSENSVYSYNYENMNIPITPFDSDTIKVNFTPTESINYIDTLYITNSSLNDSILSIALFGIGEFSPPASPTGIQLDIQGNNSILSWSVVDTTITGLTINPDGYIVLNSRYPYSEYTFLSFTPDTTYTHYYVAQYRNQMFYRVIALINLTRDQISYLEGLNISREKVSYEVVERELRNK